MSGILYAVGVGPGDPKLMTLKAVSIIEKCTFIAVPCKDIKKSVAYNIACQIVDMSEKTVLGIDMPMTKDEDILNIAHKNGALIIADILKKNQNVAFLTLGDPSVYATTAYIAKMVNEMGFETMIVSGIPSFVAAAARLNTTLSLGDEEIHIIPGSYGIKAALSLKGTKIFMKIGRKVSELREQLKDYKGEVLIIQNCGMDNEVITSGLEAMTEDISYFSIIIVR